MVEYKKATRVLLDAMWDVNIALHRDDKRWAKWRTEYTDYNERGLADTFLAVVDGQPIGECTVMYSPRCRAVRGRLVLADGEGVAHLNGLRVLTEHRGNGYASGIMRAIEAHARSRGVHTLTLGVEEAMERNVAIYRHLGYTRLIAKVREEGREVLYLSKFIGTERTE